jgi:hypothetical protein
MREAEEVPDTFKFVGTVVHPTPKDEQPCSTPES